MTNDNALSSSPSAAPSFGPRLYHGACACGAVRYEATIDFSTGTLCCNCSFCAKASLWGITIKPEDFKLLAGEDSLSDFQRNGKFAHFLFCKHCGVRAFGNGDAPWMGGPYVSLNLNCLEEAVPPDVEIRHYDGRHDSWESPRIERYAP